MTAHHWELEPVPASAAEARRLLRTLALGHHVCKCSELLVTELVANAVRHGGLEDGDRIELAVRDVDGGRLHVEVVDPGTGFDPADLAENGRPERTEAVDGGWGLRLLDRLSDDWGVRRLSDRTCVWFEVTL